MRTIANVCAVTACALMIAAPSAFGDEQSDQIAEMRAMVEQLKGQVEAQSEQIEHQGEIIKQARLEQAAQSDSRFGASGISAFLQRLQVEGWVAGSYFWNFNDPGSREMIGGNTGGSGLSYPFHQNYNNFQVDQVWFGIEHPVDAENRAGFRFDLLYGNTACGMQEAAGGSWYCRQGVHSLNPGDSSWGSNTSEFYVHQAYVQYLAPITENGIHIKAGKFATLVGAEVLGTTGNFNITRGALYTLLQPIDHVGVLASTEFGDSGLSASFGVMNSNFTGDPDNNMTKSIMGQLAWSGETLGASTTIVWGGDNTFTNGDKSGLWDTVLTWDPTENLSTWLNFDWAWTNGGGKYSGDREDAHAWGIATAARYAVTERMGVSARYEFVKDHKAYLGFQSPSDFFDPGGFFDGGDPKTSRIHTITGTVDYALTSNLMLRGEVRYDTMTKRNSIDNEFFDNGNDYRPDQVTAGAEIVYEF